MKTVSSKHFNRKIDIQRAVNTPDGYGGSNTSYNVLKTVYGFIYDQAVKEENTVGQLKYTFQKKAVIRNTEIKRGDRAVINGTIYTIEDWKVNYKGTQIELLLVEYES